MTESEWDSRTTSEPQGRHVHWASYTYTGFLLRCSPTPYIGPEGTREKLARWLPENAHERAVAPSDPREEFAAVLRDLGANLTGPHPIMDGKSHRVATLDDKRGEKSMFYVGHLDGRPAGYVKIIGPAKNKDGKLARALHLLFFFIYNGLIARYDELGIRVSNPATTHVMTRMGRPFTRFTVLLACS